MKKSLFALAAVTAFAGAAQPQSSVTVYGILDLGFVGGHQKGQTGAAATTQFNQVGQQFGGVGNQSTNRIGFRGTEDLGGGTSAFFTIENSITADGNSVFGTSGTGNRQTFVGLGQKGMGRAAIGTQYTPLFSNAAATSPGQFNNVMGDIIYGQQSGGNIFSLEGGAASTTTNQNANSGANIGFTVRTANMLRIDTDSFAGFRGQAFYTMDNSTTNQTGTTTATNRTGGINNRNGWGLGATYTWKKLLVAGNYQSLTATNPYAPLAAATATTNVVPASGTPAIFGAAANSGINIKDNQWFAGATYDFGILKAYAQYINRKATSQINATEYGTRTAQQIGVRGNWTPKIESWASVGTGRYTQYGISNPTANFSGYQLGTNYILSKRSNLYAIYGATNTSTSSAGTYYNGSQYAVGVRHTF
jgi:predicted porin